MLEELGRDADGNLAAIKRADNVLLAKLGYRSVFVRELSLLELTFFVFSVMGTLGSVSVEMSFPLVAGGHVGMVFGWIIPCFFAMTVACSLAELTSAMPTSGGLYYFSAKLAPRRWAPLASWITGWANITGQVVLMASIDYTLAQTIATAVNVGSDGAIILEPGPTFGITVLLLVLHGVVCSTATAVLARLNVYYAILNIGSSIAVIVALLVCSGENRVSTKTAFTKFENNTGWANNGFAFLLSFYAPMWTFTGYDCAAHLSEETTGASRVAPIAMVAGVGVTALSGWLLFIAVSFATASIPDVIAADFPMPMGKVYLDVLGKRGMLTVWSLVILAGWVGGAAQGVDASRVVFAFARDNALPGSRWWKRVHPGTGTPVCAVWLVMALCVVCSLVGFSATALSSLAGSSVIALYISYVTPIVLRVTSGRKTFKPGPFSLGRWSVTSGIIAIAWVSFFMVIFMFPPGAHPTAETMNYTVVIIMGVFVFASLSWVLSAHRWFRGPVRTVDDSDSSHSAASDVGRIKEKGGTTIEEREVSLESPGSEL
ncbi:amino acid transporter [Lentinus tigrinus ALCF2SS1-7]|uniref:Amino acid transporter n=1 Tax=Lentinus tigrinus ALCF2SS1-6 TaxID=1328759 RepID=A0A5C2SVR9_9APHY|nr:amino acid transporter [Lentinus tigrinus ALCF2SS1-6]RPD81432.1 amino acid transporter [Lentinus tigrinus ALCF2SS1-7]